MKKYEAKEKKKTSLDEQTHSKSKKYSQNSSNEFEDLDYFDSNMRELLFKKYNIYSIQSEKDELFILENIKTNVINTYKKNKVFNELKRELYEFKKVLYGKKINEFMDFLIMQNMIKSVYDVGFKPTQEKIFTHEKKTFLNSYTPTHYLIKSNFKTYEGDYKEYLNKYAPNIYYLISNLCNFNDEYINYFVMWLSHKIQNPSQKIQRGIVFYGAESSGKTLFFNTIIKNIFGVYAHIGGMKNLDPNKNASQYNGHKSRLIISATDECYYMSALEETLKGEITQEEKQINVKGGGQWYEVCYEDQLFFSNRELPIKAGFKRLSYIKSKTLKGNEENATKWYEDFYEPNYKKELNYLCNVLHHLEINKNNIMNNIKNDELKEIRDLTKSLEEKFIDFLGEFKTINDVEDYLKKFSKVAINNLIENSIKKIDEITYIKMNTIYTLYDLWLISVGYDKKAIDKTQLFKCFNIDTKNKTQYRQTRMGDKKGRAVYSMNIELLNKFVNKIICDEDKEEDEINKNFNVDEIIQEVNE